MHTSAKAPRKKSVTHADPHETRLGDHSIDKHQDHKHADHHKQGRRDSNASHGDQSEQGAASRPKPSRRTHSFPMHTQAELTRKFSFADCSVSQIKDAIVSEDPEWKFNTSFWLTVLACHPCQEFRFLQNRTLAYWAKRFNSWQEMGNWNNQRVPTFLNGQTMSELLNIPHHRMLDLVKLFDSDGFRRIQSSGDTPGTLAKTKINVAEVFVTGVMMSRLIPSRHKLRFVFGIMDKDDHRALNVEQFADFIHTFIRGLGGAFGIGNDADVMPSEESIATIASRLYTRISVKAGHRLKEMHAEGDVKTKEALAAAIKARHGKMAAAPKSKNAKPALHQLKFSTLQDWCFRVFKDPLALPYALAIQRYCPERYAEVKDGTEDCDSLADWYLCHTAPVIEPPDIPPAEESGSILTRAEVVLAREAFQYCMSRGRWRLQRADIERHIDHNLSDVLWDQIEVALQQTSEEANSAIRPDFIQFLRKVCPTADTKHLRMFEVWCHRYDELADKQRALEVAKQAAHNGADEDNKPIWPEDGIRQYTDLFQTIDASKCGHITVDDIVGGLGVDKATVKEMIRDYDLSEDGYLDLHEFLVMMCPPDYRLPDMDEGSDEKALMGKLLQLALDKERRLFGCSAGHCDNVNVDEELGLAGPGALQKAEVDETTWAKWNQMFDHLDESHDGSLSVREIEASGLLARGVCEILVDALDPNHQGITRQGLLESLLRAHNMYKTGWP